MYRIFSFLMLGVIAVSCKSPQALPTVKHVDTQKYLGTWYEIARLPNRFEKGLTCVTAQYSIKENGKINVVNRGYNSAKSEFKQSEGTAWKPNPDEQGILKVSFFWPFAGDYYILELDPNYQYVLVGAPSRDFLWVLSRQKTLDPKIYNQLLEKAKTLGFDINQVKKVDQNCTAN